MGRRHPAMRRELQGDLRCRPPGLLVPPQVRQPTPCQSSPLPSGMWPGTRGLSQLLSQSGSHTDRAQSPSQARRHRLTTPTGICNSTLVGAHLGARSPGEEPDSSRESALGPRNQDSSEQHWLSVSNVTRHGLQPNSAAQTCDL